MTGKVGFVGVGAMGGPMALNLVKAGFELVVHDINPARLEPLVAAGASVVDTPEAVAAECHRTICMVETTAQAEAVILGETGFAQTAKQGDIVLCMSTIDPLARGALRSDWRKRAWRCSTRRSAAARMARRRVRCP